MTRLRNNAERTAKMTVALKTNPQTYEQLATVSGLQKPAVATWVKSLRAAGMIHVAQWLPDTRGCLRKPVFGWGNKPDVAKAVKTSAERMSTYRARRALLEI